MLKFCDSFYYHDVKPVVDNFSFTYALTPQEVKRSYASGLVKRWIFLKALRFTSYRAGTR